MERHIEGDTPYDQLRREMQAIAFRDGQIDGQIKGLRDALLRLLTRARIALTEEDRARIHACTDAETLDRWIENVLGAKTAADVFS